jgi:hypothetical protein
MGTSDWILAGAAVFMPLIGIPLLIIKHWDAIKTFFADIWNDPKAALTGFIDWIGGKVEAFTAPFRAIGEVVGGIFGKIGGFFKGLAGDGAASGTQMNTAFAGGIQANAQAPAQAFGQSLTGIDAMMPHSDAEAGPLSRLTASGRALTETFASGMDSGSLENKAAGVFQAALPPGEFSLTAGTGNAAISPVIPSAVTAPVLAGPSPVSGTGNAAVSPLIPSTITASALPGRSLAEGITAPDLETGLPALDMPLPKPERNGTLADAPAARGNTGSTEFLQTVTIQNVYLQADDCEALLDMLRQLRHITQSPQEAAV